MGEQRLLLLRLGAMGDILHALPAVETLARSFPKLRIQWLVKPQWMPLLEGHPLLEGLVPYRRDSWASLRDVVAALRAQRYDIALDLQGLLQSAVLSRLSRAPIRMGYSRQWAREPLAAAFYTHHARPTATHVVQQHLEVVRALGANAQPQPCWIPGGRPDGDLPASPFVLAAPLAGWTSKQWPLEHYGELARLLQPHGLTLVLNIAERDRPRLHRLDGVHIHCSSIAGLIDASRRATAVVGLDSGPLHLAATLGKPGVALFGPTNPERNGPHSLAGNAIRVLRPDGIVTSYKRGSAILEEMRQLRPQLVLEALLQAIRAVDSGVRPAVEEP
ncbi:MAG: glycosyltransferase family 9 protein [Bryobacterales bacterium]|nr:glycosyltransferase family 9 protein [Bryobacterales bacterium]